MKNTIFETEAIGKRYVAENHKDRIKRVLVVNSNCSYEEFCFDRNGRLIEYDDAFEKTIYSYRDDGKLDKIVWPDGDYALYEYNDEENSVKETIYYPKFKFDDHVTITEFKFDDHDNEIYRKSYDLKKDVVSNVSEIWSHYDYKGKIIDMVDSNKNETSYIYDNNGNLIYTSSKNFSITNKYNESNRIINSVSIDYDKGETITTTFKYYSDGDLFRSYNSDGEQSKYYYEFYDKEEAK